MTMRPVRTPMRRRANNTQKQTVTYAILLVLVVVFLATIGIKFVIGTSLFFAGLTSKDNDKKVDDSAVLIEPSIDNLPDATNSARLAIEGRTSDDTLIEVYVNEDLEEEVESEDGVYTSEITLKAGENDIYVRAMDKKKEKTKDSEVYTVLFISKGPELTITAPIDGNKTDKEEVTVSGSVSENVTVKVNGLPTIVNSTGQFNRVVQLTEGENTITINATDLAGNSIEKQIKAIYQKD